MSRARTIEVFSMSLLDLLCVGLGAVTLLLLIFLAKVEVKAPEPRDMSFVKVRFPRYHMVDRLIIDAPELGLRELVIMSEGQITPGLKRLEKRGLQLSQSFAPLSLRRGDAVSQAGDRVFDEHLLTALIDRAGLSVRLRFEFKERLVNTYQRSRIHNKPEKLPFYMPEVLVSSASGGEAALSYRGQTALPLALEVVIRTGRKPRADFGAFQARSKKRARP